MVSNSSKVSTQFQRGVEVSYLIPEVMNPTTGKRKTAFPNPSGILRRFAFRIDGSVWMMDEKKVPETLFRKMIAAGCTVNVIRYDVGERDKVLALARTALEQELKRIRKKLEESLTLATKRFEEAKRLQDGELTNETAEYVKACFRRTKRHLDAAIEASAAFDILREADELFEAMKHEVATKTEQFFADHAIKTRQKKTNDAEVA